MSNLSEVIKLFKYNAGKRVFDPSTNNDFYKILYGVGFAFFLSLLDEGKITVTAEKLCPFKGNL